MSSTPGEPVEIDGRLPQHPLVRVEAVIERLGLPAEARPGVKAALLHVLYGVRSDEALVDHLGHNVRFQAFVGPAAEAWSLDDYRDARDRALSGGDACALGQAVTALQAEGLWSALPFTPDDQLVEAWLAKGGFAFADLAGLDDRSLQRLLHDVAFPELALAMYDGPPAIRARVDANLSARMRAMLADEIAYLGPVRPRDVEEVQSRIAKHARKLLRRGEIAQ